MTSPCLSRPLERLLPVSTTPLPVRTTASHSPSQQLCWQSRGSARRRHRALRPRSLQQQQQGAAHHSTPTWLGSSARAVPPPLGLPLLLLAQQQQQEQDQQRAVASKRTSSISSSCGAWLWRAPLPLPPLLLLLLLPRLPPPRAGLRLLPQPPPQQLPPLRPTGPRLRRGLRGAAGSSLTLCRRPACRTSSTKPSSRRRRGVEGRAMMTGSGGRTGTPSPRMASDE